MAGAAGGDEDGTTYLSTVDSQGNLVSVTPSSFAGLAQGMILGDTGILINTRGCYFWLDPDNPNCIAPHKRPRTTPCTFIVLKNGKPFMSLGTPGGDSQTQCDLQVLSNIVDFGLNVQDQGLHPLRPHREPHRHPPARRILPGQPQATALLYRPFQRRLSRIPCRSAQRPRARQSRHSRATS